MPTPRPNDETHEEWMDRCIPVVMEDGTAENSDQAVAMCSQMWEDAMRKDSHSVERRAFMPFEMREDSDGHIKVVGHAAVFNQEANIAGMFREIIRPGAFSDAIKQDVPFLINHDDLPLARTGSGTLKLKEDEIGLRVEASFDPSDPDVQRVVPKMKRGDLSKMSFAFSLEGEGQDWRQDDEDKIPLREIMRIKRLFDVSIVTTPAYDGTDIALRSLAEKQNEIRKQRKSQIPRRIRLKMKHGLHAFRAMHQMSTKYMIGDKVTVRSGQDHDGMGVGEIGTIEEIGTPALGVKFPSMPEIHKWYVDEEVESA